MLAWRAEALAKAGAQIFFQAGEGAFKGVVVLPVREIGEVIFAGFFRQNSKLFKFESIILLARNDVKLLCPLSAQQFDYSTPDI